MFQSPHHLGHHEVEQLVGQRVVRTAEISHGVQTGPGGDAGRPVDLPAVTHGKASADLCRETIRAGRLHVHKKSHQTVKITLLFGCKNLKCITSCCLHFFGFKHFTVKCSTTSKYTLISQLWNLSPSLYNLY